MCFWLGDIVDEGVDFSAEKKIPELFGTLKPRMGTFAVLGNHEYIVGRLMLLQRTWVRVALKYCVMSG